jgi:hypothetical protein
MLMKIVLKIFLNAKYRKRPFIRICLLYLNIKKSATGESGFIIMLHLSNNLVVEKIG